MPIEVIAKCEALLSGSEVVSRSDADHQKLISVLCSTITSYAKNEINSRAMVREDKEDPHDVIQLRAGDAEMVANYLLHMAVTRARYGRNAILNQRESVREICDETLTATRSSVTRAGRDFASTRAICAAVASDLADGVDQVWTATEPTRLNATNALLDAQQEIIVAAYALRTRFNFLRRELGEVIDDAIDTAVGRWEHWTGADVPVAGLNHMNRFSMRKRKHRIEAARDARTAERKAGAKIGVGVLTGIHTREDETVMEANCLETQAEALKSTAIAAPAPTSSRKMARAIKRRACAGCGGLAPEEYKWKASCCPDCHRAFNAGITYPEPILQHFLNQGIDLKLPHDGPLRGGAIASTPKLSEWRQGCQFDAFQETPTPDPYTHAYEVANGLEARERQEANLEPQSRTPVNVMQMYERETLHRGPALSTIGFAGHTPTVFAKTTRNEFLAVRHRLCAKPAGWHGTGLPRPGFWKEVIQLFKERPDIVGLFMKDWEKYVSKEKEVLPLRFEEWLKGFPASRQQAFRHAKKKFADGKGMNFKKLKEFKVFLKRELAHNGYCPNERSDPAPATPRSICTPDDYNHIVMGEYMRPMTGAIKVMFSDCIYYASRSPEANDAFLASMWEFEGATYDPCLTPSHVDQVSVIAPGATFKAATPIVLTTTDRARLDPTSTPLLPTTADARNLEEYNTLFRGTAQGGHHYIMSDYSKMDSSYSDDCFEFIEYVYTTMGFPKKGLIHALWKAMAKIHGDVKGHKFKTSAANASGRDDTAVNNALINGVLTALGLIVMILDCSIQELMLKPLEKVREVTEQFKCGIVGDDLMGAIPSSWRHHFKGSAPSRMQTFAEEGGFTNKLTSSSDIYQCVFLGNRPYPCAVPRDGGWVHTIRWGKQLGRCLYKIGWQRQPTVDALAWGKGVAWATLIANPAVPVLRAYCLSVMRKTEDVRMKIPAELWKFRLPESRTTQLVTHKSFEMMERVYGLNQQEVLALESLLLVAALPSTIAHPSLDKIFSVDSDSM